MNRYGISELIQTGILFTLLGIAYGIGQVVQKFDMRIEILEKQHFEQSRRIEKIELRIFE